MSDWTQVIIKSVMIFVYTLPTWEFDSYLLKLQRLQDRILCAAGSFNRYTPVWFAFWHSKFLMLIIK